jgi:predicted permease
MKILENATRDFRIALRAIAKMPLVATVVVVSLGLGIGVNTVVFSWIQAVVWQPIRAVPDSGSFHLVEPKTDNGLYAGTSWPEFLDLRARLRSFEDIIAFRMVPLYVGKPGEVERAYGLLVSGNYFSALTLDPSIGRLLGPEDTARAGGEPVVVISHDYWQTHFGGRPDVVSQTLRVNGRELTIVGVAPEGFLGTVMRLEFDVWLPATMAPALVSGSRELEQRNSRGYAITGRLKPGTTKDQAQAEAAAAMATLAQMYPDTNRTLKVEVLPFSQSPRGPQRFLATALGFLQSIMILLLLAVCGNTANLMLSRAYARQHEMGLRLALGSGPWRIAALLLTESVILALAGAALGVMVATWATKALTSVPLRVGFPVNLETTVDPAGLAFAILLGIGCGLVFGIVPALQLARIDPQLAIRSSMTLGGRSVFRNVLMGAQVSLALVVLVAAGFFVRSFAETRATDPGFRREGVLLAAYDRTGRADDDAAARTFATTLLDRLHAIPEIAAAAISSSVPLDIHGLPLRSFTVDGWTRTDGITEQVLANTITPGYLSLMGIPLTAGVDFGRLDAAGAPPQVIVNEAFVHRYLKQLEPIGRRLQSRGRTYVIVGVARNSIYNAFGEPPTPIVYFSYRDNPSRAGEIHVRTKAGSESTLAPFVRSTVRDLDPELPVYNVRTLGDHVESNLIFRRIPARMFTVLGPMLLFLAAIGIYAVSAYNVSLRTTEVGVRLALGATRARVVGHFVIENLAIVSVGMMAGWLIAFILVANVLGAPLNAPIFAAVPAILLVVAAAACWLPARRVSRLDPWVALRQE